VHSGVERRDNKRLTKKQVVEALGIAPRTLDLWIQKSLIAKQDRRGPYGVQLFFAPEEVERVRRERSQGTYDGCIADPSNPWAR
jgi:hypothetical protein